MEIKNKILQETRNFFEKLKTDEKSVLFFEEKLYIELLKKLKKSRYSGDKKLLKLINLAEYNIEQSNENNKNIMPIRLDCVGKREIDGSTLYIMDGPFQLMHADIANLVFSKNLLSLIL